MLRHVHPLLGADLLRALMAMGHGDEIVIADANFPAYSQGVPVIDMPGATATDVAEAVLNHLPLDTFADAAAYRMAVVGDPGHVPEICQTFQDQILRLSGEFIIAPVERFAFYEQARRSFVIVRTGEQRLYGNLILKKGVLSVSM